MIKRIFFDFDGVLVDSLEIKNKAYYDLFSEYGEDVANRAYDHHVANMGVSRFEKIPYYLKTFANVTPDEALVTALCNKFADMVKSQVVKAPAVAGTTELLEKFNRRLVLQVISGTPNQELSEIIEARGWQKYFFSSHGSPKTKSKWLSEIMEADKVSPEETLFIGDAMADHDAAKEHGIRFIFRRNSENSDLKPPIVCAEVADMYDFAKFIEGII